MEMIDTVLNLSGLTVSELDGFAVTRGPGSFTGLRIGISSIKGFAMASGKPVVGVSSLDSLAMQCGFSSYLVSPLLDARKEEVYFSRYRFENGYLKKELRGQAISPVQAVCDINEPCLFVGDGAKIYQNKIKDQIGDLAHFAPFYQNTIRAVAITIPAEGPSFGIAPAGTCMCTSKFSKKFSFTPKQERFALA